MEREEIEQIMVDNDKSKYDSVIEHVFNLEKKIRELYKDNTRLFSENISLRCCDNCVNQKCRFGHGEHCRYIFDCPLSQISSVVESKKEYWKPKEDK